MNWLKRLTDPEAKAGKALDRIIYLLILLSLIQFALETSPEAERYKASFV